MKNSKIKIVINAGYGGFGLSQLCVEFMAERDHKLAQKELDTFNSPFDPVEDASYIKAGFKERSWYGYGAIVDGNYQSYKRTDPLLIEAIEHLGKLASGDCATLKVIEIPDDIKWHIEDYDGFEHIAEDHQTWS